MPNDRITVEEVLNAKQKHLLLVASIYPVRLYATMDGNYVVTNYAEKGEDGDWKDEKLITNNGDLTFCVNEFNHHVSRTARQ